MKQNLWCKLFKLHKYEIIREEKLHDRHNIQIGIVLISRCTNCGKIKSKTIYTEDDYVKDRR